MTEWNVLVTALTGRRKDLARLLNGLGKFRASGYRDVLLGQVASSEDFLRGLRDLHNQQRDIQSVLGRVIPFEKTFQLSSPEALTEKLCEVVSDYVPRLSRKKFYVRFERRGFKGRILSPEVERAVDQCIQEKARETGGSAEVDFEDADVVVAVEMVSNLIGVSLLTREIREKYSFVRVE